MQGFLTVLIECSVSMSVLALVFIALTPRLSKIYAAKWLYYAWLVVALGFVIPFRLHPNIALIRADTLPSNIQQIMSGNVGNIAANPAVPTGMMQQGLPALPWYQIAGFLWAAGAVAFIAYQGLRHYRSIRMVKRWSEQVADPKLLEVLQGIKDDMNMAQQVGLQICSCVSSPMVIGFVHPVILLPRADFSEDELSFVLRHELVHLQRKDLWHKSLVLLAATIHWFNPVIYLMAKAIAVQCEISCDAEVVQNANIDGRQHYGEIIIRVIKYQSTVRTALSTYFYGGKNDMKARISSIMDITKKKAGYAIVWVALAAILGAGALFTACSRSTAGKASAEVEQIYYPINKIHLNLNTDGGQGVQLGANFKLSLSKPSVVFAYHSGEPSGVNFAVVNITRSRIEYWVPNAMPGQYPIMAANIFNPLNPDDVYQVTASAQGSAGNAAVEAFATGENPDHFFDKYTNQFPVEEIIPGTNLGTAGSP